MAGIAARAGRAKNMVTSGSKSKRSSPSIGHFKWKPNCSKAEAATPPSSSNLGKFLGIPPPTRSEISILISKFIKLNNRQNPGLKKDPNLDQKLKAMLSGKEAVGIPEVLKLLNQQFVNTPTPSSAPK